MSDLQVASVSMPGMQGPKGEAGAAGEGGAQSMLWDIPASRTAVHAVPTVATAVMISAASAAAEWGWSGSTISMDPTGAGMAVPGMPVTLCAAVADNAGSGADLRLRFTQPELVSGDPTYTLLLMTHASMTLADIIALFSGTPASGDLVGLMCMGASVMQWMTTPAGSGFMGHPLSAPVAMTTGAAYSLRYDADARVLSLWDDATATQLTSYVPTETIGAHDWRMWVLQFAANGTDACLPRLLNFDAAGVAGSLPADVQPGDDIEVTVGGDYRGRNYPAKSVLKLLADGQSLIYLSPEPVTAAPESGWINLGTVTATTPVPINADQPFLYFDFIADLSIPDPIVFRLPSMAAMRDGASILIRDINAQCWARKVSMYGDPVPLRIEVPQVDQSVGNIYIEGSTYAVVAPHADGPFAVELICERTTATQGNWEVIIHTAESLPGDRLLPVSPGVPYAVLVNPTGVAGTEQWMRLLDVMAQTAYVSPAVWTLNGPTVPEPYTSASGRTVYNGWETNVADVLSAYSEYADDAISGIQRMKGLVLRADTASDRLLTVPNAGGHNIDMINRRGGDDLYGQAGTSLRLVAWVPKQSAPEIYAYVDGAAEIAGIGFGRVGFAWGWYGIRAYVASDADSVSPWYSPSYIWDGTTYAHDAGYPFKLAQLAIEILVNEQGSLYCNWLVNGQVVISRLLAGYGFGVGYVLPQDIRGLRPQLWARKAGAENMTSYGIANVSFKKYADDRR